MMESIRKKWGKIKIDLFFSFIYVSGLVGLAWSFLAQDWVNVILLSILYVVCKIRYELATIS
jgi:hypothetical protein